MSISVFIRRLVGRQDKRDLVRGVVSALRVDDGQKELYLQAIELIDEENLEALYANFVEIARKIEDAEAVARYSDASKNYSGLRRKEMDARIKEENSASILIDNI